MKVGEHIPSVFSMSTILSFTIIENKHDVYRGKDCMKMFCKFLRKHTFKIINLQMGSRNHMKISKSVIFVIKISKIKMKIKFTIKLGTTAIIQENIEVLQHSICNLRCNVPNEIPFSLSKWM